MQSSRVRSYNRNKVKAVQGNNDDNKIIVVG